MDDVAQIMENEIRRLDRAIFMRRKRLEAALDKAASHANPRRYTVDVTFDATSTPTTTLQPVSGSAIVDQGTCFYCTEVVGTLAVLGTITINGSTQPGKVSVPLDNTLLGFLWQVRDTYNDRSWQSLPLPGQMLASGKQSGLLLARPVPLPSGTEVELTVTPFLAAVTNSSTVFAAISQWLVEISFCGYEVFQ